jgi:hypothetical protein
MAALPRQREVCSGAKAVYGTGIVPPFALNVEADPLYLDRLRDTARAHQLHVAIDYAR